MFEYLMPDLVLRAPGGSLLAQTSRLIVQRQIGYGAELELPWGVSESAYNARDLELTYQYSNFGVPGLGLKRGLVREQGDRALRHRPRRHDRRRSRARQLHARWQRWARAGRYGFYEAVDFTPSRVPEGATAGRWCAPTWRTTRA